MHTLSKITAAALGLALIGAAAAPALADDTTGYYGTLGYNFIHNQRADTGLDDLSVGVGYRFNPYVAVEGQGAFGIAGDHDGAGYKYYQRAKVSANVLGLLPVAERTDLFVKVGVSTTDIDHQAGISAADGPSFDYGLGAQHFFDAKNGVRADWTRSDYHSDHGVDDTYSIAYVRKF